VIRSVDKALHKELQMGNVKVRALVGQKIAAIRTITPAELAGQGWDVSRCEMAPLVIVTEDGTKLFASRDSDGNGPGYLVGETKRGKGFYVGAEE